MNYPFNLPYLFDLNGMAKICDINLCVCVCVCDVYVFSQDEENKVGPEKLEEAKLKAKYPHLGNKPGGSDLLRKRLQKGVRFIHTLLLPPILVGWIAVLEEKIQITGLWWFYTGSRTSQHHVSHEPLMALVLRDNRHKFWSAWEL